MTPCKERYIRAQDLMTNCDTLHGQLKCSGPFRTKSFIPSTKLEFETAADDDSSNSDKIRNGGLRSSKRFWTILKYLIGVSICVYLVDLSRKIYETIIVPFDNCTLAKDLCETSNKCCFKNCGSDSKSMFWTNFKRWK
uniref:Uncharacterized protein n=1 Tax=Romanomermis culicivorax TaxID=13658 RepID=A0A915JN26_ROMCU